MKKGFLIIALTMLTHLTFAQNENKSGIGKAIDNSVNKLKGLFKKKSDNTSTGVTTKSDDDYELFKAYINKVLEDRVNGFKSAKLILPPLKGKAQLSSNNLRIEWGNPEKFVGIEPLTVLTYFQKWCDWSNVSMTKTGDLVGFTSYDLRQNGNMVGDVSKFVLNQKLTYASIIIQPSSSPFNFPVETTTIAPPTVNTNTQEASSSANITQTNSDIKTEGNNLKKLKLYFDTVIKDRVNSFKNVATVTVPFNGEIDKSQLAKGNIGISWSFKTINLSGTSTEQATDSVYAYILNWCDINLFRAKEPSRKQENLYEYNLSEISFDEPVIGKIWDIYRDGQFKYFGVVFNKSSNEFKAPDITNENAFRIIKDKDAFTTMPSLDSPAYIINNKGIATNAGEVIAKKANPGTAIYDALFKSGKLNPKDKGMIISLSRWSNNWPAGLRKGNENREENFIKTELYQGYKVARWVEYDSVWKSTSDITLLYIPANDNYSLPEYLQPVTKNGFFIAMRTKDVATGKLDYKKAYENVMKKKPYGSTLTLAELEKKREEEKLNPENTDATSTATAATKSKKMVTYLWWQSLKMSYPTLLWTIDYAYIYGPEGLTVSQLETVFRRKPIRFGFVPERKGFLICANNNTDCSGQISTIQSQYSKVATTTFLGSFNYNK